jgi:hypothetical protein
MSLTQTALAAIFRDEMGDPARALAASVAWNKLLLLNLNALLVGYLLPPRTPPREPAGPRSAS